MSRTCRLLFASMGLMVVCALAASCAAADDPPANQGPGRGGRGGAGGPGGRGAGGDLVSNEKVQADLKLTDDQKESIKKISASAREGFQGLQGLSREERTAKMQELRKDQEDKVAAVLTDAQKTRMKEIRLQARGTAALSDKEVQESLKLTDDQVNKIKDLNKTLADARAEAFGGAGGGGGGGRGGANQETRDKLTKLRTETNDKILAVLTADQKTAFEKMQGAKIEGLPTAGGGFGFGGGAGGGGRRNRGGNGGNGGNN